MAEFKNKEEYEKWKAEKAKQALNRSIQQEVSRQTETIIQNSSQNNQTTTSIRNDDAKKNKEAITSSDKMLKKNVPVKNMYILFNGYSYDWRLFLIC